MKNISQINLQCEIGFAIFTHIGGAVSSNSKERMKMDKYTTEQLKAEYFSFYVIEDGVEPPYDGGSRALIEIELRDRMGNEAFDDWACENELF